MIIITDRPGQLCNRLWSMTPFIAYSLKHDVKLYVAYFDDYAKHFENLERYGQIKIHLFRKKMIYKGYKFVEKTVNPGKFLPSILVYNDRFNDFNELYNQLSKKEKYIFIKSWMQPFDIRLIDEYKSDIVRLFKPKKSTRDYVDQFFGQHFSPGETVVGVHIRRTDYKHFKGGKYFYTDTVYKEKMLEIQNELQKKGKKAVFLMCSDSSIDPANFTGLKTRTLEHPSAMNDLYALSRCDCIMGPPSTFSMWASFYGDVPLRFIKSKEERMDLSEFSPVIAQNRFKNGRVLEHEADQ